MDRKSKSVLKKLEKVDTRTSKHLQAQIILLSLILEIERGSK